MRFRGVCYRAHDPKWAWAPVSGDGAAIHGGRFNPRGVPALYLASSITGMFAEMGYGFARRFDPLTVCAYDLDMENMVDLRTDETRKRAGVAPQDMANPWMLDLVEGRRPRSWDVAQKLIDDGAAGILVPSFANGAQGGRFNIVLWNWGGDLPHKVTVFDPSERLPKDQASWEA